MHEISIVRNIIDIVTKEAGRSGAENITGVNLEIGQLSGVDYETFEFALKTIKKGSIIESAEIIIDKPEGTARCNKCGNEFTLEEFTGSCNKCHSCDFEIIKGRELRVKSITV